MQHALIVNNIVKKFTEHATAVDNVNLQVKEGEIFGLLGPNGAGKTTLIRILTCLMKPTEGKASIRGFDIIKDPGMVRKNIGVVSQASTCDLDLTAFENMDIFGKYYEIPQKIRRDRIENLLSVVNLTPRKNDLAATYSGGMRRRLELARGLINDPYILFLDEPTIGLDPQSRRTIWDLLLSIRKKKNLTIFITTHYMDEADILCDRIAIIDYGKIIALDSPTNLKKNTGGFDIIEITLSKTNENIIEYLKSLKFIKNIIIKDSTLILHVEDGAKAIPILVDEFKKLEIFISYLTIHKQSLEDVFIHYTGKSIREGEPEKVNFLIGAGVPKKLFQR
jgi:ABC-2 type transport system ATP-binding protein